MKSLIRFILGKNYKYLNSKYWKLVSFIYPIFIAKKGTLVYAGINVGDSFQKIFYKYNKVLGFEPNIKNYDKIKHYNKIEGVKIFNFALSTKEGIEDFYLPDNFNNDASASLSDFSDSSGIKSTNVIKVKTINLCDVLINNSISEIDFYISDTEGYDFTILKTIYDKYIKTKKIQKIQVEAVNNLVKNPFIKITNYESDFDKLLLSNYNKTGVGSGIIKKGDNFKSEDLKGKTLDLLYQLKQK